MYWIRLVMGPFLLLGLIGSPVLAGQLTLSPADMAVLDSPAEGIGDVVLLRFNLPTAVTDGRVTRAVLQYEMDCSDEEVSIWANPTPASWTSATVGNSWWTTNASSLSERNVASFEAPDCAEGVVFLDIGRWVRAWSEGRMDNFGLLIRRPPDRGDFASPRPVTTGTPVLRVTFRPASPSAGP